MSGPGRTDSRDDTSREGPGGLGGARPTTGPDRLRAAMGVRPSTGQLVAAVLLGALGFAMVVQARTTQEAGLEGLRQGELVRVLDDTSEASARLRAEAAQLEETRRRLSTGTGQSRAAIEEAGKRAETLGILAGTLPAVGPGIVLRVPDPGGVVTYEVLLDAVQELRDAGAEAMQLGPVRVVASTYLLDGEDGGIVVDGTLLEPPYELSAIGDPRTLATALDIPGGILDTVRGRGTSAAVEERDAVEILALRTDPEPQYARPAPEGSAEPGN